MKLLPQELSAVAPNLHPSTAAVISSYVAPPKLKKRHRTIKVNWPAINEIRQYNQWLAWESAYIALLSNQGLTIEAIAMRLKPLTIKVGRPSRNPNSVYARLNILWGQQC